MLNINETIRSRRHALGMTQEQLADRLGVSAPAVSKWEQGASYPDVTLLPALARTLGIDMNTLMGFARTPEKAEITRMLTRVNDTAKAEGVEAGMALAREYLREYPSCGALLFGLAATLEGRMIMAGMTQAERAPVSVQLEDWYARAADSDDEEAFQVIDPKALLRSERELLSRHRAPVSDRGLNPDASSFESPFHRNAVSECIKESSSSENDFVYLNSLYTFSAARKSSMESLAASLAVPASSGPSSTKSRAVPTPAKAQTS